MTAPRTDQSPLWDPILAALLLTRLPLPRVPDAAFHHQARAVWAFPLVGMVLGLMAALAYALGPTPMIAAGLALATLAMLTGGLHEDGLADTVDGLWGGHDRPRRLDIMKDSRIGAYGVLALVLVTGLRWSALTAAGPLALVAAASLSRASMPVIMAWLPHARADGLSRSVGAPTPTMAFVAAALGTGIAAVAIGVPALKALAATACVVLVLGWIARRKIGGQTGDILGAAQQLSEAAILIVLVT
ncbi:MAG: adenosylcobinamide-GDP ribazoletransferase [Pseudomonadota bacterium]